MAFPGPERWKGSGSMGSGSMGGGIFDPADDDEWQEMPVIRSDSYEEADEDDRKLGRRRAAASKFTTLVSKPAAIEPDAESPRVAQQSNATGQLLDLSEAAAKRGEDWREKAGDAGDESDYTRLGLDDDPEEDHLHEKTQYLFDDDKGMTPLSQMQATKGLLSEGQRIAYVGMCRLVVKDMVQALRRGRHKELEAALASVDHWSNKIMTRLYQHMDVDASEQRMIEQLAEHGVHAADLAPSLITTRTVPNPNYDPIAAREAKDEAERKRLEAEEEARIAAEEQAKQREMEGQVRGEWEADASTGAPATETTVANGETATATGDQGDAPNLISPHPHSLPGVSTTLTTLDPELTLDIRWTVLCDLFLAVIADSVYDARSRVLLLKSAAYLGIGRMDVVRFERRLTEALEVQEGITSQEAHGIIEDHRKKDRKRRYMMMGAAAVGGGLVIGLSAGLLAPVIGAGIAAGFTTIGVTGTSGFLAGAGGAAVITTAGTVTGMNIGGKGMAKRTKAVAIFRILPLHNNKRVNVYMTMPGFMSGPNDDVRLPFSVLDQTMGDVLSVLWEPEMMGETGNILRILTSEVLTQLGQQVLQATVLTALMSALQWPIMLTKLGYLIDNPWSNALDRAKQAGAVLADVLIKRHVGLRPVSLIGFSLGARAIFYALMELAKRKAYGIVEEVYLLGATVTASNRVWREVRGVVAGRFVNGYCQKDWILGYLYRATTGGLRTVAGLGPVDYVPDLENVDLTELLVGHMSYRVQMPLLLEKLGFRITADHFDEPDDMEQDDGVGELTDAQKEVGELEARKRKAFSLFKGSSTPKKGATAAASRPAQAEYNEDEDEPPGADKVPEAGATPESTPPPVVPQPTGQGPEPVAGPSSQPAAPVGPDAAPQQQPANEHDTFDIAAIRAEIARVAAEQAEPAASIGDGNDDLRRKWLGRPAPPPGPSTFVPEDDGGASWDLRPTLPDTASEDTPPTPVVASVYEDALGQTDKAWSAPPPRKSSDAGAGRPTISFGGEDGAVDDEEEGDMARPHAGWRTRRDTVTSNTWRHDPWNA